MTSPRTPRLQPTPRSNVRQGVPLKGGPRSVLTTVLILTLIGTVIWNVNLRADVDNFRQELQVALNDNAALRERANATVYQLLPTQNGPDNAHAQAWFSIQGSGILSAANMPPLPEGRRYQLWYITDSPTNPIPGGTFSVDVTGQGFMLIPSDVGTIASIAISVEPESGSQSPTGPMLLATDISGARG